MKKFLPGFTGDGRDEVTIRHLLTHVSGLPDQLANNNELRKQHAPLTEFATHAIRTRLDFAPGSRYQYSSMAPPRIPAERGQKKSGSGHFYLAFPKAPLHTTKETSDD